MLYRAIAREIEIRISKGPQAPDIQPALIAVHLFKIVPELDDAECLADLSYEERWRAARIAHLPSRAAFLATRILLRELLATELGCTPPEVPIVREADGKPRLACGSIEFSLSHPDGWGAIALSPDCPVGVDVEPIRPLAGLAELASEFFPPRAQAAFLSTAPEKRQAEFFRWWTRLEAAAKVFGRGIDNAASCLSSVVYESCDALPGVAMAVAAPAPNALAVHWHVS